MKPGKTGLKRVIAALGYSRQGLASAWRFEAAFRQECMLALVLVPVALWLELGLSETLWLVVSLMLVLVVELLNSAIEAVVDRIGPEHHELAGRAKDTASAAVLLTLLLAVFVWAMVLGRHFLAG
ncbi:diacylglycerol kinase [Oceanimonas pelagia]|uniref:Diacylglycerol kinase n=1 Tax=Oceanimonas pelagia TaxID=3028314 RepID=A0AA50KQS9_9GAMM|nr:diacylglycerol kinase [Oceanimonas pelagia]WMC11586.1 diacylglycerol kinase [Oceanimonas pelagia]